MAVDTEIATALAVLVAAPRQSPVEEGDDTKRGCTSRTAARRELIRPVLTLEYHATVAGLVVAPHVVTQI